MVAVSRVRRGGLSGRAWPSEGNLSPFQYASRAKKTERKPPMTHQPDRVAQVVAWLRDQADSWRNNGLTTDRARIYIEAAIAIEAGEPFKETPDE